MTHGFTLGQLFATAGAEQFLVPEIQRDYVWGEPQLVQLLASLRAACAKARQPLDLRVEGADANAHIAASFTDFHRRRRFSHHLGFLYAYHDHAYPGKAFLIDGQQRLLTLYLLLLARAVQENQQEDFRARFLVEKRALRLDYRVREATHEFLPHFVRFVLDAPPRHFAHGVDLVTAVRAQYWFFRPYDQDPTIRHVLDNYAFLTDQLPLAPGPDYDYLQHYVRFWYFDTGDNARGEDLYLSLNSTGLLTSAGENQRARLLELEDTPADKARRGRQLEGWQGFFWKHRLPRNSNADRGFTEFFRWVRILGPLVAAPDVLATSAAVKEALLAVRPVPVTAPLAAGVNLATAERLMEALALLWPVPGSAHPAPVVAELLPPAWLAPDEEGLGRKELFRLLPVLAYCLANASAARAVGAEADWQHLPRLARYLFNLGRQSTLDKANEQDAAGWCAEAIALAYVLGQWPGADVAELPELAAQRSVSTVLLPPEEAAKLRLYRRLPPTRRGEAEALLWALEDDRRNNGEVSHLCADAPLDEYDFAAVQRLSERYWALELANEAGRRQLQTLFLFQGDSSIQYKYSHLYEQYDYGRWRLIVRNHGGVFTPFFRAFLLDESLTVAQLYERAKRAYFAGRPVVEHLTDYRFEHQLCLLALVLDALRHQLSPDAAELAQATLWPKGSSIGYFYPEAAHGRDEPVADEQLLFGEHTLRFWNVSDRLTSRASSRAALLPQTYALFQQLFPPGSSYQDFVENTLLEAGALI